MRGRNGTFHRYYYCRNHDILRAGGEHLRCPERNIRADDLDAYVFAQVRRALLEPAQLIAGEQAVITATPPDDDELIGAQLATLERKRDQTERERGRLLDAYQAALLDLDELTRRTAALTARRDQLAAEHAELTTAAPSSRPRTGCDADSPASPNACSPRSTNSTSTAANASCAWSSRKSASPAGASRSTSRSPSPTTTQEPNANPGHPSPAPDRQAIWACVPLMALKATATASATAAAEKNTFDRNHRDRATERKAPAPTGADLGRLRQLAPRSKRSTFRFRNWRTFRFSLH